MPNGTPRSLALSLFLGEIHEDLAFPYPQLSPEEADQVRTLLDSALSFVEERYDEREVEAKGWVGDDVIATVGERGLMGLYVSEQYGGQGLSQLACCKVFEEMSRAAPTLTLVMGVHQSIGMKAIHLYGTPNQKARLLPDLATGNKLAGLALTEPNAGSDLYHVESRAERQADGSWLLNGEKRWIGNGSKDVLVTLARTEEDEHLLLILEKGMDGLDVGERHETMGFKGNDLRPLSFHDVRVPENNVLGAVGDGYDLAMDVLVDGRISLAAATVGTGRQCLQLALDHVQERRQFDRPIADFELVEMKIGEMASDLYGLEAMTYLIAGMGDDQDLDRSLESSALKVFATEYAWHTVNRAFQLAGGRAYMADQPYAKILRDTRIFPIFEGANDVLRAYVALSGLKELGDELEDLQHLDFKAPLQSLGAVADYVGTRAKMEVRPDRVTRAHDALDKFADPIAGQVKRLRTRSEHLLRNHGKSVIDRQGQLARLSGIVTDVLAQLAVLARLSAAMEENGDAPPGEREIAEAFRQRAARRVERTLEAIDENDDERLSAIAQKTYSRNHYGHSLYLTPEKRPI